MGPPVESTAVRTRLGALLAVLLVALPAGAIAATSPPGRPAVPAALDRFFKYQRPAAYGSVMTEVRVAMRDGVHLDCYLYQPTVKGTSTPAIGRFPGIIDNFTPYYIAYPFSAFSGKYFSEHGYLDVECTPRGTGLSEGTFGGWFSALETRDNFDLIEWLVHHPRSTGKVAQEGDSYGGMTAYRVAALHPPGLITIAPQQSYSSLYLDYTYPGGIRSLGDPYWFAFAGATGAGHSLASTQEVSWLQHPLLDGYWRQIDIDTRWSQIRLPILGFGGWPDIFQDAMARNYVGLAGPDTYLVDGPWTHGSTFDATVTQGAMLAWFDRWLGGDDRAPLPPTHVASYVMPNGPWTTQADWPPPDANPTAFALTTAGRISPTAGASGGATYVVSTAAGAVDLPAFDHLVFTGPVATVPTTIAGAGELRLRATLTDPTGRATALPMVDTNFVLHLFDVAPSGTQTLMTRGYLKASQYRTHAMSSSIPLGARIDYRVPLWHVHWRLDPGHHLVLTLASGESNCCLSAAPALAQPLLPLRVTVATGASGSTLVLPLTPAP